MAVVPVIRSLTFGVIRIMITIVIDEHRNILVPSIFRRCLC